MLDSPFWEEQRARERAQERALERVRSSVRMLLTFASTRSLTLPADAEQRLSQLDATTLEALIRQAFTAPDSAAAALLEASGAKQR